MADIAIVAQYGSVVEKVLEDGSYLSWIAPDSKSKKKGSTKILLRA